MSAVRHNPTPYTLPVIPRPLPSNIVEGEHFVLKDVGRLASGSASSSRDLAVEAPSQVQEARSASSATSGRGSDLLRLLIGELGDNIPSASLPSRRPPELPPCGKS